MSSWIEKIFKTHQHCKECSRGIRKAGPVSRVLCGFWSAMTGVRIYLKYTFFRPGLPEPLTGESRPVLALTSFPPRMKTLWMVIDVLMRQAEPPSEIVLTLYEGDFVDRLLPATLEPYLERGLTVLWASENLKPHLKYRYVFERESAGLRRPVVTVDDDLFYSPFLLRNLLLIHRQFPDAVCAGMARVINAGSYDSWPFEVHPSAPSLDLLALGFGGVLYPVHVYDRPAFRDDARIKGEALPADDLFLRIVEREEGIGVAVGPYMALPPSVPSTQAISLSRDNVTGRRNDRIWQKLNKPPGEGPRG